MHGNLLVQRRLATREGEDVIKSLKLEARLLASSVGSLQSSQNEDKCIEALTAQNEPDYDEDRLRRRRYFSAVA